MTTVNLNLTIVILLPILFTIGLLVGFAIGVKWITSKIIEDHKQMKKKTPDLEKGKKLKKVQEKKTNSM